MERMLIDPGNNRLRGGPEQPFPVVQRAAGAEFCRDFPAGESLTDRAGVCTRRARQFNAPERQKTRAEAEHSDMRLERL